MKIKKIKYGNFRNFAKEGEITFSTDGKLTLIYGTNGDGKTTLHQLFQWILYGNVNFNRTTSAEKLYNLERGYNLPNERSMYVWGEIEFEHNSEEYIVRREWEYYKQATGNIIHKSSGNTFYVEKQNENKDWKQLEHPETVIETVLPSGLASYFFFDGETMIADLKMRGTDSAKTLKQALNSIFDLEIYDKALRDIGTINKSQSVLGHLYNKQLEAQKKASKEKVHRDYITDLKKLHDKIELIDSENEDYENRIKEYNTRIKEISEEIGGQKSKRSLENSRKILKQDIDRLELNIKEEMLSFGNEVANNYSYLLISEVVKEADKRLYLQVQDEEKRIIPGLTKELLNSLLKNKNITHCICGHEIDKEAINTLEEWRNFFPPASYKSTYDKFTRKAIRYSGKYDDNSLFKYFKRIIGYKSQIREKCNLIDEIDNELKGAKNIDNLITERIDKEKLLREIKIKISENVSLKGNFEHQIAIRERQLKKMTTAGTDLSKFTRKIELMEGVKSAIKSLCIYETKEYSQKLQEEIQDLVDKMLTSKREVSLNEDFQLQVKDSYGDESKSEGQFAVISFAYIGGILKVLKSYEKLSGKDYPLILDGPFSKLNDEHKINVLEHIPKYAPQVVIFSKDYLGDIIEKDKQGKVYTIKSNKEKNNAIVEEGYLWN